MPSAFRNSVSVLQAINVRSVRLGNIGAASWGRVSDFRSCLTSGLDNPVAAAIWDTDGFLPARICRAAHSATESWRT